MIDGGLEAIERANLQLILQQVISKLREKDQLDLPHLIKLYQRSTPEKLLPLSIFTTSLYPIEAITKYFHEEQELSFTQIAELLNRNPRNIWTAYQRSQLKIKKPFSLVSENYYLPIHLFQKETLTPQEAIVTYLRSTFQLPNKKIAALLNTSPNSVAVLMKRVEEKT